LNPFDPGIADSEDIDRRTHHAMPRVIASLVVAFFAYIGFALGGGLGAIANNETNSFSAGKSNQPLYLSLRDTARGIVAAERDAVPKNGWHDGHAALVPAPPSLSLFNPTSQPRDLFEAAPPAAYSMRAYLARGPPITAA
jgi:uncharacterized iron-regulated membrane protein